MTILICWQKLMNFKITHILLDSLALGVKKFFILFSLLLCNRLSFKISIVLRNFTLFVDAVWGILRWDIIVDLGEFVRETTGDCKFSKNMHKFGLDMSLFINIFISASVTPSIALRWKWISSTGI